MKKSILVQASVAVLMIGMLLFGRLVTVPDNMQTLHGFPLVWGKHQLATIAGPVNYWMVNLTSLAVDIVVWIALILVIPLIVKNTNV